MRSTNDVDDSDLSTRARIRSAAVEVFVHEGFSAPIRTVATRAGVSPGLVIHHFGSKAGLRAECDAYVLDVGRARTGHTLGTTEPLGDAIAATMQSFARDGNLVVYITRILSEGGPSARSFVDRLVADTEASMREAVSAGTVRPSIDEAARARYLVSMSLGVLTIDLAMNPPPDPTDGAAIIGGYVSRMAIPATEYATHGLFTDTAAWDAVTNPESASVGGPTP